MAISFINGGTAQAANGGNPVLTISGWSLQQNDLVVAAYSLPAISDEDLSLTTAGYTEVADLYANDTNDINLGVFYKFMGASPDSDVAANGLGDTNNGVQLAAIAFRGVDTSGPFDVTSQTTTGINSALADPPSIDWSTSGVWTVIAAGSGVNATTTYTFPSGYTTNAKQASQNETRIGVVGLGYNSSPSDPENPGAFAISISDSTNFSWAAVTMALKPAAGGGGAGFTGWGVPIF